MLPVLIAVLLGDSIQRDGKRCTGGFAKRLGQCLSFSAAVAVVEMNSMVRSCMLPRMYPVLTAALRETWEAQTKVFTSSRRTGWAMVSSWRRRTHS